MPAHIGSTYPVPTHIVSVGVALALRRNRLLMSIKYVLTTHVDAQLKLEIIELEIVCDRQEYEFANDVIVHD